MLSRSERASSMNKLTTAQGRGQRHSKGEWDTEPVSQAGKEI